MSAMSDAGEFRVWVLGCKHVGTDLRQSGRQSLAEAIRQAENGGDGGGPPFDWDIALHLGDLSGSQTAPDDEEGEEVVRQFGASTPPSSTAHGERDCTACTGPRACC